MKFLLYFIIFICVRCLFINYEVYKLFNSLRIQIIEPCKAHCKWCGTWKKNEKFYNMISSGGSSLVHNTYKEIVKKFRPSLLILSGGEPLFMPGIGSFIKELSNYVSDKILIFTSFQYSSNDREKIELNDMPWAKVILTHTSIGFNKSKWEKLTGFSFDTYIDNIKNLSNHPWNKKFKFILNHEYLSQELDDFINLVKPDKSFQAKLKFMNNQSGDFGAGVIKKTKGLALAVSENYNNKLKLDIKFEDEITGKDIIKGFLKGENGNNCPFRKYPNELRFAFFKGNKDVIKLKYRFCPYFPSDKYYMFKVGIEDSDNIIASFYSSKWHRWCSKCRLRLYSD